MAVFEKFYTDGSGQQYRVAVDYERDGSPRGYYLSIYPVELSATEYPGIFSVSYTIDAEFMRRRVHALQIPVKRASKKAEADAIERAKTGIEIYFYPYGIAHVGGMAESVAHAEQRKAF